MKNFNMNESSIPKVEIKLPDGLEAVVKHPKSDLDKMISCWISPQGDVYPCSHMEHVVLAEYFIKTRNLSACDCTDPCDILHARGWARITNFPSIGFRIIPPTPYYKLNKRQWDLVACFGYDEYGIPMHHS